MLRLLQLSDSHFDAGGVGSELNLPPGKRAERASEARAAFQRALHVAREQKADLVLIPGDLWNDEAVSADTVALVASEKKVEACVLSIVRPNVYDD